MNTLTLLRDLRAQVKQWRQDDQTIALVPTMGNLHAGHISLVERARQLADKVIVSIFVNPLQFGAGEDYDSYPRTYAEDSEKLYQAGADILFLPSVADMYPLGLNNNTKVEVPELGTILCGESRPIHFSGVTTVVAKLFNLTQPDKAVFGEKDFQQLFIIRRMVADLCMPIDIVGVPTFREDDGLAMSSRNGCLPDSERDIAPNLHKTLSFVYAQLQIGIANFAELEAKACQRLQEAGFEPDYLSIRCAETLQVPTQATKELIIVAAAKLGKTRLIDNMHCSLL